MIGNSLKSDVLPLLNINASAVHVPFYTTWVHEEIPLEAQQKTDYITLVNIKELITLI
jgi:putative hydrolase of the HAD superfamily